MQSELAVWIENFVWKWTFSSRRSSVLKIYFFDFETKFSIHTANSGCMFLRTLTRYYMPKMGSFRRFAQWKNFEITFHNTYPFSAVLAVVSLPKMISFGREENIHFQTKFSIHTANSGCMFSRTLTGYYVPKMGSFWRFVPWFYFK